MSYWLLASYWSLCGYSLVSCWWCIWLCQCCCGIYVLLIGDVVVFQCVCIGFVLVIVLLVAYVLYCSLAM